MKIKNQRSFASLALILTAVLWSLGGLLIKSVDSHPLAIAGARSTISAILILLYIKKPRFTWSFAQIGAALCYAMTSILFVAANKLTTAANAILLQYTAPLYVALLGAWLLKEKAKLIDWATIGIVLGGMVLFFMDSLDTRGVLGSVLAVLSGVTFALFAIFMRMQKNGSPVESVLLGNVLTAIIGVPFLFTAAPDSQGWLYFVVLGVIQLGIPYILYSYAIKHVTALEASLIPVIEPILNPIWVFLFMGEAPGGLALIGGVIVVVAVTMQCILKSILPQEKEEALDQKETSTLVG